MHSYFSCTLHNCLKRGTERRSTIGTMVEDRFTAEFYWEDTGQNLSRSNINTDALKSANAMLRSSPNTEKYFPPLLGWYYSVHIRLIVAKHSTHIQCVRIYACESSHFAAGAYRNLCRIFDSGSSCSLCAPGSNSTRPEKELEDEPCSGRPNAMSLGELKKLVE